MKNKKTPHVFRSQTARRILNAVGGETTGTVPEHSRRGNSGQSAQFFRLVGDFTGPTMLGKPCDHEGNFKNPSSPAITLYPGYSGRPVGAKADYFGIFFRFSGAWRFSQGPCVVNTCDSGDAFISAGTVPDGHVNETYTHTVTWDDLVANPAIQGLPPGLSYNSATGEISGTPTAEGVFTVVLTGTSVENDCPITEAFLILIGRCRPVDAYIDPDDPPSAEVGDPYSHTILFGDLDGDPTASGLPPGLSLNGTTGEISGTPTEEGNWLVAITGVTQPNGCTIQAEFNLHVLPACQAETSRIFKCFQVGTPDADTLQPGTEGDPYYDKICSFEVKSPLRLVTTCSGCDFPSGLTFDGATGEITGTPTECGDFEFDIEGDSDPDDCLVTKRFKMVVNCPCPDPEEYGTLLAWLVDMSNPATSLSIDENIPFNEFLASDNADFNTSPPIVSNLPPGLTWDPATGEVDGIPDTAGTYVTVFYGKVLSGPHVDCPIIHTRTYTVS